MLENGLISNFLNLPQLWYSLLIIRHSDIFSFLMLYMPNLHLHHYHNHQIQEDLLHLLVEQVSYLLLILQRLQSRQCPLAENLLIICRLFNSPWTDCGASSNLSRLYQISSGASYPCNPNVPSVNRRLLPPHHLPAPPTLPQIPPAMLFE